LRIVANAYHKLSQAVVVSQTLPLQPNLKRKAQTLNLKRLPKNYLTLRKNNLSLPLKRPQQEVAQGLELPNETSHPFPYLKIKLL